MSFKLDTKKFVKTSSDEHHTVMRDDKGHELKIAHKALSAKMKAALDAIPAEPKMADGGQVKDKGPAIDPQKAKEFVKGATESGWQPQRWVQNVKQALSPGESDSDSNKMADGGEVADSGGNDQQSAPQAPVTINIGQPSAQMGSPQTSTTQAGNQPYGVGDNLPYGVDAGSVPPSQLAPQASREPSKDDWQGSAGVEQGVPGQQGAMPTPPLPNPAPQTAQNPQVPTTPGTQSGNPAPHNDPYGNDAYGNALTQGLNQEKAGIRAEALGLGAQGNAQAKYLEQAQQTQQKLMSDYDSHFKELDTERQALQHDVANGHIDPNHFMNSKDTFGKISTALGLILGGMGAGMLGSTDNPALKFINMQIDRDIEAQKSELGKKENLLSANMKQFGNLRDATDMTRIMQRDLVANQLQQAVSASQDQIAKGRGMKELGALTRQSAGDQAQVAMRRTMMSGGLAGGTPDSPQMTQTIQAMRSMNPAMAKSLEERYVPGVGLGTVPVPTESRNTIIAKQQLQNMSQDFYKWAQSHSGSVDPATVNEGKTKAAELQSLYRNSINGGVFKKGEQEFIDNIVDSDPTKFFNNIRVLPKLEEVMKSNSAQLNTLKKGFGLPATQIQESAPVIKK